MRDSKRTQGHPKEEVVREVEEEGERRRRRVGIDEAFIIRRDDLRRRAFRVEDRAGLALSTRFVNSAYTEISFTRRPKRREDVLKRDI